MFTQEDLNMVTTAINGIAQNVDRITTGGSDSDIDTALKNILDSFQSMGILPYIPLIFVFGISMVLSFFLYIRVAHFFNLYYPSKGAWGSIFNYKFISEKDVNFVRRVLKVVEEYEPPKTNKGQQQLPQEPDSNNYLRRVQKRSGSGSARVNP